MSEQLEAIRLKCKLCGGVGATLNPQTDPKKPATVTPCSCSILIQEIAFLGPEISRAEKITSSPLAKTQHAWVKANWQATLPHLRLVLLALKRRKPTLQHVVITDEQIRASMFAPGGATALVTGPDLVVIRLGFVGGKNDSAPTALLTALMDRIDVQQRPCWVIEDPRHPLEKGHHSWSKELNLYLVEKLHEVKL